MKALTLTALLLTALFTSAIRLPASVCAVASPPIGKSCQQGCCGNKVCCADSQKNKSLPSTPAVKDDVANQQLVAIPATGIVAVCRQFQSSRHADFTLAKTPASTSPQLAVLCTFLI
jgi:hypothetical protein